MAKSKSSATPSQTEARSELKKRFAERGYVRKPDLDRRTEEGSITYRKGYEVRLPCDSKAEATRVAKLLRIVELKPGKPFAKGAGFAVPIYGKDAVDWFTKGKKGK
jgi:hypothetical protein